VAGSICDLLLLTTELRYQWRKAESHQELVSQAIKGRKTMRDSGLRLSLYRASGRAALKLAPLAWLLAAGAAQADGVVVSDAWTPPNGEVGSDVVLGMVVTNDAADADALVRVSCPVANFSERRQIDIGEGGKSARAIHDIPIAAKSKVVLNGAGFHVALLQTRQELVQGEEFQCSVSFRRAGVVQVQVRVLKKAPGS
jgi:copper(I)-binding protein